MHPGDIKEGVVCRKCPARKKPEGDGRKNGKEMGEDGFPRQNPFIQYRHRDFP